MRHNSRRDSKQSIGGKRVADFAGGIGYEFLLKVPFGQYPEIKSQGSGLDSVSSFHSGPMSKLQASLLQTPIHPP
jgi:hypothetical protein